MSFKKLSNKEIEEIYDKLVEYHKNSLKKYGVVLPKLRNKEGKFTKNALVLIYLARGYPETCIVNKEELTNFIRSFEYYKNTADVQQGRHLGAQQGWYIVSGGRDNGVRGLARGAYKLISLEKPYPGFKKGHRIMNIAGDEWETLKQKYNSRCATCGSKEGERHFHWPNTITKLQKAHKDPNRPLEAGNVIPQCQKCNRADRNRWVYDDKGRVVKLAQPKYVLNFDEEVQKEIYKILYQKFNGKNPESLP